MLNQDYKDILLKLIENKVDFLLIGAYALAVHGFPRATGDIDIFVKPSEENARRVYQALADFGAPLENIAISDFATCGTTLQIGVNPRRIDLLTKIDGLSFAEAAEGKDIITIEGLAVPVISRQKLRINKLATGREKDRLDAEHLK